MSIILAATWKPRGELERFKKILPVLMQTYSGIALILPPDTGEERLEELRSTINQYSASGGIILSAKPDWSFGRHLALKNSLELPGEFIQYADLDRLLRWVETRREEWLGIVKRIPDWDHLVIGRTQQAYDTHPQALIQTEAISNLVTSHLIGESVDVSAGSKGFSRRAIEFLIVNAEATKPFAADASWTILLRRGGFRIGIVQVDGLDWESADRHQTRAADTELQRQAANQYDADPDNWRYRGKVAFEIVEGAFTSANQPLVSIQNPLFDFTGVFDVDDYMYFYGDMLTPERTEEQIEFLVDELGLDRPKEILDLACGYGRHANQLTKLGHSVTGIDLTPGFLEIARNDAQKLNITVNYLQGDMRDIDYDAQFDHVLLLFTAFGYFEDDQNLDLLKKISRALKHGGSLVFDIQNRDTFMLGMLPYIVTEKDGNLMIDRHSFDSSTGRLYNQRIVIRNGLRRDKPFFVRMYNPTEIRTLLAQAGLEIYKMYGGWERAPVSSENRRMVIIAKKP